MNTKFPFSLDNIPRQTSFACLSLKFGSVLSALVLILYSIFALAQCLAAINMLLPWSGHDTEVIASYAVVAVVTIIHIITLFLSTLMLVGVLKERPSMMKMWVMWTTILMTGTALVFVFWITLGMINHFNDNSLIIYMVEFLGLMVRFYMLMIVSSYYKQLDEKDKEEKEKLRNLVHSENWYNSA